jgi:hypothetical protein
MATWLELRCENRSTKSADGPEGRRCWSDDNIGPMEMASDNRESLLETVRQIEQDARAMGWKKTRDGWVCPYCLGKLNGARPGYA